MGGCIFEIASRIQFLYFAAGDPNKLRVLEVLKNAWGPAPENRMIAGGFQFNPRSVEGFVDGYLNERPVLPHISLDQSTFLHVLLIIFSQTPCATSEGALKFGLFASG